MCPFLCNTHSPVVGLFVFFLLPLELHLLGAETESGRRIFATDLLLLSHVVGVVDSFLKSILGAGVPPDLRS